MMRECKGLMAHHTSDFGSQHEGDMRYQVVSFLVYRLKKNLEIELDKLSKTKQELQHDIRLVTRLRDAIFQLRPLHTKIIALPHC